MTQLRKAYEQQLTNLIFEARAPLSDLTQLSNENLLAAINSYLEYFNCDIMDAAERIMLSVRLNGEVEKK